MLKIATLATMAASLLGVEATLAAAPLTGEARLAQAVRGREAGRPLNCLNLRDTRSTRVIDRTAIIFESGNTLYINRPLEGAESLSESDALLTKSLTGEICRGEGIRLFDNASGTESGVIFLGEFVPYRRARSDRPQSMGGGFRSYRR